MKKILLLHLLAALFAFSARSQNQASQWYFGLNAGLDFLTSPPNILNNGLLGTPEGCSSIADGAGNLLFYTDGQTVWNQSHNIMANGNGLAGDLSSTQVLIVKQPGNTNIYFVFTADKEANANGISYSVVDLSLASGQGSVTAKNVLLQTPSSEKLTATRHCNGVDVWIMTHDWNNSSFRAFLVSSAGVSASPVISSLGSVHGPSGVQACGAMKFSPNGKKLGVAVYEAFLAGIPSGTFEVFDFNNSTGIVSNHLLLGTNFPGAYGCAFSPDGKMFYGARISGTVLLPIHQWNLCAGTFSAVKASQYLISTKPGGAIGDMQLAPNGKIYVSRFMKNYLSAIHNPNVAGAGCNYVDSAQSLGANASGSGLPNFISNYFNSLTPPPAFSFTTACLSTSFAASGSACSATQYTANGRLWNFNDPASGSTNTSTLSNPGHTFSAPGTYTVSLINNYACSSDTLVKIINVSDFSLSVSSSQGFTLCKDLGPQTIILSATGAQTYSWQPGSTLGPSLAVTPTVTSVYTLMAADAEGCAKTQSVTITVADCASINNLPEIKPAKIFPNPGNGRYTLVVEKRISEGTLQLYNILGMELLRQNVNTGENTLNLEGLLEKGIYHYMIMEREKPIYTGKLMYR